MGTPVASETRIYAAVVSIDIGGAIPHCAEYLACLDDTNGLTPLPSEFLSLSPLKWPSTGCHPLTLS